jgi:hypothetical protein
VANFLSLKILSKAVKTIRLLLLFFFCLLAGSSFSQIHSSAKNRRLLVKSDTLFLDSLSLVPGTVKLDFLGGDSVKYQVNHKLHAVIFDKNSKRPDSVKVSYKTFPYNFEKAYFHREVKQITKDLTRPSDPFTINFSENPNATDFFMNDGLNKNGSISRGITFGNNQDVVVNSNLNLQVSGKLTPEIDIMMAATDNNIPFQADGTTAQLQEFDKVFIQLNNQNTKLIVGDYQLGKPANSYFMNFYKRAQGIFAANTYIDSAGGKPIIFRTQLAGAVSKGKFARNVVFGTENNQGPYRLKGADNEQFIIVLSGTERIYIDGKLLQRGQENDYIIDYNTAELTFTAKQIITKDKRIVAEFQYAERNYGRSLIEFGEEIEVGRLKIFGNIFSEQDNRNKPLQQALTQEQKKVMFDVGDTLSKAYSSGVEEVPFNNSDVFYWKKDTVVNSILYPGVFVYSTNPDSARYRAKFSNVGTGNGNYIQVSSTANGKVYKWMAPEGGVLMGSYEPVIPLVTPKQLQMATGGFSFDFNKNHSLVMEGVFTKNDINTFSPFDTYNDQGYGYKFKSLNKTVLQTDSGDAAPLKALYNFNYEYVQKNFTQVERFRSVEFQRDWNRPLADVINTDQHIASAELGVEKMNRYKLLYGFNSFLEGSFFSGYKQSLYGKFTKRRFLAEYNGSYLTTQNNPLNTEFYRHKAVISQGIGKIKVTLLDDFENNIFKTSATNSLLPRTYQFWEWEANLTNADTAANKMKLFYRERRDKQAYSNDIRDSTFAQNVGAAISINSIRNHPITFLLTYRELHLKNVVSASLKPDNTLLSRVEYSPRLFKNFITSTMFYETGYGLENKKEFYYIEVAPGQGQYAWNDYNGNTIKELNEFETAAFSDQAQYIRVYTPTNQYVKVLQNQLSFSFNLRPNVFVKESTGGFGRFMARFATQTVYRVDNKTYDNGQFFNSDFLTSSVNDTLLLATNYALRQSVFFNQSAAVFGMDYTFLNNKNKQLLLNGFDSRDNFSHELRWRFNFFKSWSLMSNNSAGLKTYASQFFSTRNYSIEFYDLEQKLSFQPSTAFRASLIYKYTQKQNIAIGGFQRSLINDYALELKYNQSEKGSFSLRADFLTITYNDIENSPVAYEMLNALKPGYNYTWNLSYQRNLTGNVQVSINYDGRISPNSKVVHIGGAQVRAFF